jgi:hypothetical protein
MKADLDLSPLKIMAQYQMSTFVAAPLSKAATSSPLTPDTQKTCTASSMRGQRHHIMAASRTPNDKNTERNLNMLI